MSLEKTKLLTLAFSGILVLVFGVYSNTINYAHAVSVTTYSTGANYSVFGGDYRPQSDTWFFASGTNNTIIEFDDNSSSFITGSYSSGACADVHDIKVINGGQHLAMLCNNATPATFALQIRTASSPYTLVDEEQGWANTEDIYEMVEWVGGDRLYVLNSGTGSPLVYMFNLNNINSTISPMFQTSVGASNCNIANGITIKESSSQAFVSCNRVTTSVIGFATIELSTFTSSVFTTVGGATTSTGGLQIDYNSDADTVAISVVDTDDIYVWSLTSGTLTSSNTNICDQPLSPQFNENTAQLYIVCKGASFISIYNVANATQSGSFTVQTFSATAPFGANNAPEFVWEDSIGAGYLAYAFIDGNHGNLFNFVTRIEDTTSIPSGGGTGGIDCNLAENANILICRLNAINTTPLASATETTQESIFNTLVQIGLLDGSNEDCATNGVGYIMVASALGIEAGLFFVATRGGLKDIPSFVWIIATLVIVGMITAFDCLEAQWFIITIIAVVALGAMKLKGLF